MFLVYENKSYFLLARWDAPNLQFNFTDATGARRQATSQREVVAELARVALGGERLGGLGGRPGRFSVIGLSSVRSSMLQIETTQLH